MFLKVNYFGTGGLNLWDWRYQIPSKSQKLDEDRKRVRDWEAKRAEQQRLELAKWYANNKIS